MDWGPIRKTRFMVLGNNNNSHSPFPSLSTLYRQWWSKAASSPLDRFLRRSSCLGRMYTHPCMWTWGHVGMWAPGHVGMCTVPHVCAPGCQSPGTLREQTGHVKADDDSKFWDFKRLLETPLSGSARACSPLTLSNICRSLGACVSSNFWRDSLTLTLKAWALPLFRRSSEWHCYK